VNPEALVICHGGPISEPPDAEYIIRNCRGVDGFYGASSVERLPAERAIAEQIRTFKAIRRGAES
jgi:predicted TIM-barrel enzyme